MRRSKPRRITPICSTLDTQTVLFEKKADELMQPASMSKLMTLAVVFEALEQGKITLQTEFPVSEYAWRTGGAPSRTSAMFAPLKAQVTVEDLLQGIIIQSANDACIIIAEGLAGSDEAFAQMMTDKARTHRADQIDLRQFDRPAAPQAAHDRA